MDQDTRNKLQRATQQIRQLLEHEFAEQLEGTFDILSDGTVLSEPGKHLDAKQRLTRHKLVAAIEHIGAGGKQPQEAIEEYTREAAFTFLNRFVALRMLEARQILQECVSKGDQSSGFREFCGLAPGLSSLADDGYRLYLESLCDELSVEVKVLFDRRDSASLLWPRRGALTAIMEILGEVGLEKVWPDDETIGWVYQYFNSSEERKQMREESQIPRSSRELAVRNQFFTPRYVVKFLVDNTLGRLWYEMKRGHTRLADECRYMVHNPTASSGNEDTSDAQGSPDSTSDLATRSKKDPRDLKILDPACGSGHFLLYAFELLLVIYEEAWGDDSIPPSTATGRRLHEDFPELSDLHASIPALVLSHNLFGVDIDQRATQIAALALWMRGQRALNEYTIERTNCRSITKSNIVCAESMPGDELEVAEFLCAELTGSPEKELLGQFVQQIIELMSLAGEAGSLLRIEESIAHVVSQAKEQWFRQSKEVQQSLFETEEEGEKQRQLQFDVTGITDADFWAQVEHHIYDALQQFSQLADRDSYTRRLFSNDLSSGFAFIDLCRNYYDVVLMNPPFGDAPERVSAKLREWGYSGRDDIGMAFVERFCGRLSEHGRLGALTSRVFLANDSLDDWRKDYLLGRKSTIREFLDIGYGVLDDAVVEVASYVVEQGDLTNRPVAFHRVLDETEKSDAVGDYFEHGVKRTRTFIFFRQPVDFLSLPGEIIPYQIPESFFSAVLAGDSLESHGGSAPRGLYSGDDFRFLRLAWECPEADMSSPNWFPLSKGGEYSPFWGDIDMCVNWSSDGIEIRNLYKPNGRIKSRPQNIRFYFRPGLTYTERTTSDFGPRILPAGVVISDKGQGIFLPSDDEALAYLGGAYSRLYKLVVDAVVGSGDCSVPGSAAKDYRCGLLAALPPPIRNINNNLLSAVCRCVNLMRDSSQFCETSPEFVTQIDADTAQDSLLAIALQRHLTELKRATEVLQLHDSIESTVAADMGLTDSQKELVDTLVGPHACSYSKDLSEAAEKEIESCWQLTESSLIDRAVSKRGARRQLTKKSYIADRRLEVMCHQLEVHPQTVVENIEQKQLLPRGFYREVVEQVLQYCFGCAIGRWDIRKAKDSLEQSSCMSPFDKLPTLPPGQLRSTDLQEILTAESSYPLVLKGSGILVDDPGHQFDVTARLRDAIAAIWSESADLISSEACEVLSSRSSGFNLADWIRLDFFQQHQARYSKSRRKAPIYWQLSIPSSKYSVWLYYHRLNRETFFEVSATIREKREHEKQKLDRVRRETEDPPTGKEADDIEVQEKYVADIASMLEEVDHIAPLWNPDLNDGVIINFAPLWRLVPQNKSWQKECKKCWDKLVKGDYDWAHLAMHLWPERVVPKCAEDASLAIAHGLEHIFWEQDDRDRFQPKEEPEGGWEPIISELVEERTSPAVKAALQTLLDAPAPNETKRRKRARARA